MTLDLFMTLIYKDDIGLHHDDSLMMIVDDHDDSLIVLWERNGQQTDKIRRNIKKVLKTVGFQIEIETNLHKVNFLDITFHLRSRTYRP